MGKKKVGLGRTLIKDRFGGSNAHSQKVGDSQLHTSELQDGYNWGRLNLQSVTENSYNNLDDFLATAELADNEFSSEKQNIKFVSIQGSNCLLSEEEKNKIKQFHYENKHFMKVPRRPPWNKETTAEALELVEKDEFLKWRRQLAEIQEVKGILMTPYEKNLECWKQLWRVLERSDIIIQVVDARNPLLFRCEDIENYALELSSDKLNIILINKADFLSTNQRVQWAKYFDSIGLKVLFYSALQQGETSLEHEELDVQKGMEDLSLHNDFKCSSSLNESKEPMNSDFLYKQANSSDLLNKDQLIDLLGCIHSGNKLRSNQTTIGLVGYPNVGKSSTINSLLKSKKVSVSSTPGKTKHFQTIKLKDDLFLCDCPGLVMPTFMSTKAEMILSGILPIDQLRDHVPPISLLASLIPKHILEETYGIFLPSPREGDDPNRPPTSDELLSCYGFNRGFMTSKGIPDQPRSARYVLKDFVNGRLLYCHAPPNVEQQAYHLFPKPKEKQKEYQRVPQEKKILRALGVDSTELDKSFFTSISSHPHIRGRSNLTGKLISPSGEKEGKQWKKHNNRNKREKLRRVYGHLDE